MGLQPIQLIGLTMIVVYTLSRVMKLSTEMTGGCFMFMIELRVTWGQEMIGKIRKSKYLPRVYSTSSPIVVPSSQVPS